MANQSVNIDVVNSNEKNNRDSSDELTNDIIEEIKKSRALGRKKKHYHQMIMTN